MAVAHDASSESHTGTTGSTSEASFSWSHGGAGSGVKGVLVFTFELNTNNGDATGVTYGGVAMMAVPGGVASDTATEAGRVTAWFLGTSVPQGTQTIAVTRTNNADVLYAIAMSVTAAVDTEVYTAGIVLLQENQVVAEQSVTDGSIGVDSMRYAGLYTGSSGGPNGGANSTNLQSIIIGAARGAAAVRETTAGQGARLVGWTIGGADDVAAVHLAIREVVSGDVTITIGTPGAITWAGSTVVISTTDPLTPGALTWAGATVVISTSVPLTAGAITWAGSTVGIRTTVPVTPGALTWAGQTVVIQTSVPLTPGAITWAGSTVALIGVSVVLPAFESAAQVFTGDQAAQASASDNGAQVTAGDRTGQLTTSDNASQASGPS